MDGVITYVRPPSHGASTEANNNSGGANANALRPFDDEPLLEDDRSAFAVLRRFFARLIPFRTERSRITDKYRRLRLSLCLSNSEIYGLYKDFKACNYSGSGMISLEELLEYLDLDRSFLSERMYNIYREGEAGICFKSFVLATWNLCSRDNDGLAFFAFQNYDIYGRGWLGLLEVTNLLREVFGDDYNEKHTARVTLKKLCHVDVKGRPVGARVTFKKFLEVSRTAGVLLFPAFELQRVLQERTGGITFWEALTVRRAKGVATGRLDIRAITRIANEGKPRKRSVVAVSENHFLPMMAALADGGASALPEGLRGVSAARQRRASKAEPFLEAADASAYVPPPALAAGTLPSSPEDAPTGAQVDPETGQLVMPEIDVDAVEDTAALAAQEADEEATRQRMMLNTTSRRRSLQVALSQRAIVNPDMAINNYAEDDSSNPYAEIHGGGGGGGRFDPSALASYTAHDSRTHSRVDSASGGSGDSGGEEGKRGGRARTRGAASDPASGGSAASAVSTTSMMQRLNNAMSRQSRAEAALRQAQVATREEAEQRMSKVAATRKGSNATAAAIRAAERKARGR